MQHILKKLKMLDFPDELETYNKIIRVIKSCINSQQLRAASIMIDQFYWLHCIQANLKGAIFYMDQTA